MAGEIESNRPEDGVHRASRVPPGPAGRAVGTDPSCSVENRVLEVDGVDILIRNYRPTDATAVRALFATDRVAGGAAPPAVPDDLQQSDEACVDAQGCRFWVAEERGELVGLVGLLRESAQVGRLRRLRIAPRFRETTLPVQLLRSALQYGREQGLLKIVFVTDVQEQEAVAIFGPCGYRLARRREREGRFQIEFYLDLYERAACERKARAM